MGLAMHAVHSFILNSRKQIHTAYCIGLRAVLLLFISYRPTSLSPKRHAHIHALKEKNPVL